jgi:hypothetical protein
MMTLAPVAPVAPWSYTGSVMEDGCRSTGIAIMPGFED